MTASKSRRTTQIKSVRPKVARPDSFDRSRVIVNQYSKLVRGFAAAQCGKALPYGERIIGMGRLLLPREAEPRP